MRAARYVAGALVAVAALASLALPQAALGDTAADTPSTVLRTPRNLAGAGLGLVGERVSNRLIVKYKAEDRHKVAAMGTTPGEERVRTLNARGAGGVMRTRPVAVTYLKSITAQTHVVQAQTRLNRMEMLALSQSLAQDPEVEYVEVDEIAYPHLVPNDADYATLQWNLKAPADHVGGANLPTIWDTRNGAGVVVAVIDSGYRLHADLAANVLVASYDFVSEDAPGIYITANDSDGRDTSAEDPGDWVSSSAYGCTVRNSIWHGTHVAGVIAAVGNNGAGIIGAAHGAKILPVRALGVCGGYTSDIVDAMRWAAGLVAAHPNANVAKVINLSLGSSGSCNNTYQTAIDEIRAAGSVVVVSTGNSGVLSIGKPANCKGVIAVTAHTKLGDNAEYANTGVGTSLSAPGGGWGYVVVGDGSGIYSTANAGTTVPAGDSFVSYAGTSFSAAHVSAVAALLFEAKPAITPDEVMASLVNSTRPHPAGTYCESLQACGSGLLDAQAAVAYALGGTPFTSASSNAVGSVATGTTITLTGVATTGNLGTPIATVEWVQLAGPAVTVVNDTALVATFVVPTIAAGTSGGMYFRFRATNTLGLTSDSWVSVQGTVPAAAAPAAASTDGGSGSVAWMDVLALALLALASLALRKQPGPAPHQP